MKNGNTLVILALLLSLPLAFVLGRTTASKATQREDSLTMAELSSLSLETEINQRALLLRRFNEVSKKPYSQMSYKDMAFMSSARSEYSQICLFSVNSTNRGFCNAFRSALRKNNKLNEEARIAALLADH